MNFFPKELEDIIIDYKEQLESKEHKLKFKKSLEIIKNIRTNISYSIGEFYLQSTIGPFYSVRNYTCTFGYQICIKCNNFKQTCNMDKGDLFNCCKCIYNKRRRRHRYLSYEELSTRLL
jgi:hypothetical protein